jgi:hypothetical protein
VVAAERIAAFCANAFQLPQDGEIRCGHDF